MDQLLGFIVLTGPLFLMVLWVPICIGLAIWAGRRFIRGGAFLKIIGGLLVFLFVLPLPVVDEVAGRIYLKHLCETDAGVKVYKTVELPAEYWDEQGRPKFFNKHGYLKHKFWLNTLDESTKEVGRSSSLLKINVAKTNVKLKYPSEQLGEIITFRFMGGWIARNFTSGNTAISCAFIRDSKFSRNFYGKLFERKGSSK